MKHILNKEEKQEVTEYIKECFERAKEEWEECYPEPFEPDFIIIPMYYIPRFTSSFELITFEEMEYNRKMNEEIIRQMQAKGYKYNVCDEDIEFYK